MSDGYDNWLSCKIDSLKRTIKDDEWDEYLAGRLSGLESALDSHREYTRRSAL